MIACFIGCFKLFKVSFSTSSVITNNDSESDNESMPVLLAVRLTASIIENATRNWTKIFHG